MKNQVKKLKDLDQKKFKLIFENGAKMIKIVAASSRCLDDHKETDAMMEDIEHVDNNTVLNINYAAPKHCAIIPLCPDLQVHSALQNIFSAYQNKFFGQDSKDDAPELVIENGCAMLPAKKFNQNLAFYPAARDLLAVLDTAKIADVLIFVVSAVEEVDAFGEHLMTCIKSQGVPANVVILVQVSASIYLANKSYYAELASGQRS